jgi:hypothetical protein
VHELREYNGDKLVVAFDPEGTTLPLEVAYRLARARVLMAATQGDGIDAAAVHGVVERALGSLDETRKVKTQLTGAVSNIEKARGLVEGMEAQVRRSSRRTCSGTRPSARDRPSRPLAARAAAARRWTTCACP